MAKNLFKIRMFGYYAELIVLGPLIFLGIKDWLEGRRAFSFLMLALLTVIVLGLSFEGWLKRRVYMLLVDELKLDDFKDYFNLLSEKGFFPVRKKEARETAQFVLGQDLFLRGDFQQAEEVLMNVNLQPIRFNVRKIISGGIRDLVQLSQMHQSTPVVGPIVNPKNQAIQSLLSGQETSYFENDQSANRLPFVQQRYYRGLNELIKGNDQQARKYFQSLEYENPQLFYVQEAKKFIDGDNRK